MSMRSWRCALALSMPVLALSIAAPSARADLVFNGGFETGDFSGWDWSPAPGSLTEIVSGGAHGGTYQVYVTTDTAAFDELSQSLATLPGQQYEISFWLRDAGLPSPTSGFEVWWEGTQVFGIGPVDVPGSDWGLFTVPVTAAGPGSLLRIRTYNADRVHSLDDISVNAVPAPGAAVTGGIALAVVGRRRRRA